MRPASLIRGSALLVALLAALSCDGHRPLVPTGVRLTPGFDLVGAMPGVVVSQVYGGGGNAGATLTNDFVELHNTGSTPLSLAGWSVQYASAAGTSWQVTPLSGTIQPGAYYLVQEAKGSGGTVALPTPDATGTIAMSATAGKIALVSSTTALSGQCPSNPALTDLVTFGSATGCGPNTPTLSNTTAAIRNDLGCLWTGDNSTAFAVAAPAPRNSGSAVHSCGTVVVGPVTVVTIAPDSADVPLGTTKTFTASGRDANGNLATTTFTWVSADAAVATVDTAGVVTPVALGATTVTATSANGVAGTAKVVVVTPSIAWLDVSSSSTSFPAGFQTQLFVTARVAQNGLIVPADFTFQSLDPSVVTVTPVANTAILTGVTGSATRPGIRITATPLDGGKPYTFTTYSITIETPAPAPTSIYGVNDEFGDPTAAGAADPNDFLIVRPQYTLSYNQSRGTPNWVSYELDARQTGGQDRCNCFTADPLLPADRRILTSDYTNGGYDRGHMAKSADRTAGNADNAATFYLTNIVPQAADLNQGPWAAFENALSDSSRAGRAVYVVTGPLYSASHGLTFLKNEGKVAVPDTTWKVAFIGPVNGGVPFVRGDVQTWDALPGTTVLAVMMPNVSGIKNDPWSKYLTTVDRVEAATGYDLLSLLPVAFQTALEAGDRGPAARFAFTGTQAEGSFLAFDASATTDPDLGRTDMDHAEALAYSWAFGDGTTATGAAPSKAFAQNGTFTVTLTVTDAWGWPSVVSHDVLVANVAPQVAQLDAATILQGETYAAAGSFTDPGADTWTASVDYGDGSGMQALALDGKTFQLSHRYGTPGSYTVAVSVNDGDASASAGATVVVLSSLQGIAVLGDAVGALGAGSGPLGNGEVNSLRAKLNAAGAACRRESNACGNVLGAFVNEVEALVNSGRLGADVANPLIAYAERVIASLGA